MKFSKSKIKMLGALFGRRSEKLQKPRCGRCDINVVKPKFGRTVPCDSCQCYFFNKLGVAAHKRNGCL